MRQCSGPGPVFIYESLLNARDVQVYATRSLFVLMILIGLVVSWIGSDQAVTSRRRPPTSPTFARLAQLGERFFYTMAGVQLSLVLLAVPAAAAGSICMDRARYTGDMLVTDLSDAEIVLGKLGVPAVPILGMIACGMPVAALVGLLEGSTTWPSRGCSSCRSRWPCWAAPAITVSVWATRTHEALIAVYVLLGIWLLSLPIWYAYAVRSPLFAPPAWFEKANPFVCSSSH